MTHSNEFPTKRRIALAMRGLLLLSAIGLSACRDDEALVSVNYSESSVLPRENLTVTLSDPKHTRRLGVATISRIPWSTDSAAA